MQQCHLRTVTHFDKSNGHIVTQQMQQEAKESDQPDQGSKSAPDVGAAEP